MGTLNRQRLTATLVFLALIPLATEIDALYALTLVAAVCASLVTYEVFHFRGPRAHAGGGRAEQDFIRLSCEHMFGAEPRNQRQGIHSRTQVAAAAAELGIPVLSPMTEHGRYDLVFELGAQMLRVQCKWASRHDVVIVPLSSYRISTRGRVRTVYSSDEIDAVAAYCADLDRVYLLPGDLVDGLSMLYLRLSAPRNGQRAALHWAADYELGAVAQGKSVRLAAERTWVRIPPAPSDDPCVIGAHEFRNRFGWYLERAAAGEEIRVTRRRRPHVRLIAETRSSKAGYAEAPEASGRVTAPRRRVRGRHGAPRRRRLSACSTSGAAEEVASVRGRKRFSEEAG